MERMFRQAGGVSMGGLMAGSLLSSIAGAVIGSMIAQQFLGDADHGAADPAQEDWESSDADPGIGDGGDFDLS